MTDNQQIFAEILAAFDYPVYNPSIHLLPSVAAERWHCEYKTALIRLRDHAEEWNLEEITVMGESKKRVTAFKIKVSG